MSDPSNQQHNEAPIIISATSASGGGDGNTLLPMLVWGLVLITVSMMVLMWFV